MVKQVWMSRKTQRKSRYGLHILGGIFGIAALALVVTGGGTVLGLSMGWPVELFSPVLCAGVTVLMLVLSVGLGRRSVEDTTVFFLTEEDRLFVIDARRLANYGGDMVSTAAGFLKTQQFLRTLARSPHLPAGADEILRVEGIKENRSHYALTCRVRRPDQRVIRRTYFLVKGMEDQEFLLRQLERREKWAGGPEVQENRKPGYILLGVLVCCGFGALCVLSHPAVARLPQSIYFPCLGAAFAALCCVVWLAIRQHRGE